MTQHVKPKLGDIVRIPLRYGRYAYGRIYNDTVVGLYSCITKKPCSADEIAEKEIVFYAGVFDTAIKSGKWKIIGSKPFAENEDSWPPPQYIQDIINPDKYQIYYKGEIRPASPEEIKGLDRAVIYKPEQLVEQIENELTEFI
jgi:hypothetical protein